MQDGVVEGVDVFVGDLEVDDEVQEELAVVVGQQQGQESMRSLQRGPCCESGSLQDLVQVTIENAGQLAHSPPILKVDALGLHEDKAFHELVRPLLHLFGHLHAELFILLVVPSFVFARPIHHEAHADEALFQGIDVMEGEEKAFDDGGQLVLELGGRVQQHHCLHHRNHVPF